MACRPVTAALIRLQRDTAVDENSARPQPQKSDGTDGVRPKNGIHLRCEYSLLAPEEPEGV